MATRAPGVYRRAGPQVLIERCVNLLRGVTHPLRMRIRAARLRREAAARRYDTPAAALREAGVRLELDCLLCKQPRAEHRIVGHLKPTQQGAFSVDDYRLVSCGACGTVYINPPPSAADLKVMYEDATQFTDSCYTDPVRVEAILGNLRNRLGNLVLFPKAGESCLEVGAGFAWASHVCKEHDTGIVTVAQDVSSECADRCPWVDRYVVGEVESLPLDEKHQLISLTHVIEHLLDPGEILRMLAERLQPGGHIYVSAPYQPSMWKPEDGIGPWLAYSYLHVPAHVSYLSKTWFEQAAARCGLRLVRWDPSHEGYQVFEAVLQKA